jgi:hypothetical protein
VGECWEAYSDVNPPRVRTVRWSSQEAIAELRRMAAALKRDELTQGTDHRV